MNGPWHSLAPAGAALLCTGLGGCDPRSEATAISFYDVAPAAGVDVRVVSGDPRRWYIVESNGSGAAWLDYDGDGDVDLFVPNGGRLEYQDDGRRLEVVHDASSRLYRNDGRMRFTDVTDRAGARRSDWVNGVATGDVDNDGDPDLYLACFGPDVFLRNDGGRFTDATEEAGLGCELWGAHAVFGDADGDGNLDLFVSNYVQFDPEHPPDGGRRMVYQGVEVAWGPEADNRRGFNTGAPNRFWYGDGEGHFREATAAAGLALSKPLCSYAAVFSDVDLDGDQDLMVANDIQPCNLFINRGDGTFQDEGVERGFAFNGGGDPTSAMGLAVEDIDGDGAPDCLRTNFDMEPDTLLMNDGTGRFTDRTAEWGLDQPSVKVLSWSAAFLDIECDGDLDLMVANGHVMPQAAEIGMSGWAMHTQVFERLGNDGGGPRYRDVTALAGPGLEPLRSSRGLAVADADDDGDPDVVITDLDSPPRLLENRSRRMGHWISVALEGTTSNRDGYGARVLVTTEDRVRTREMRSSGGLYCAHDKRLLFGLGPVQAVQRVQVHWPSGQVTTVEDPPLDALLLVREPEEVSR